MKASGTDRTSKTGPELTETGTSSSQRSRGRRDVKQVKSSPSRNHPSSSSKPATAPRQNSNLGASSKEGAKKALINKSTGSSDSVQSMKGKYKVLLTETDKAAVLAKQIWQNILVHKKHLRSSEEKLDMDEVRKRFPNFESQEEVESQFNEAYKGILLEIKALRGAIDTDLAQLEILSCKNLKVIRQYNVKYDCIAGGVAQLIERSQFVLDTLESGISRLEEATTCIAQEEPSTTGSNRPTDERILDSQALFPKVLVSLKEVANPVNNLQNEKAKSAYSQLIKIPAASSGVFTKTTQAAYLRTVSYSRSLDS